MKNWRHKARLLGIAAMVVVLIAVVGLRRNREPVAGGRTFSSWFHESETMPNVVDEAPPTRAIRSMGTAAIPYLVARMRREDPPWLDFYNGRYASIPKWARRFLPEPRRPGARQETAAMLLNEMGPTARAAAPELIAAYDRAYIHRYHLPTAYRVDWTEQLTNRPASMLSGGPTPLPEGNFRLWIMLTLARQGGDDKNIIPLLLCALNETDKTFRSQALYWLKTSTNLASAIKLAEPTVLVALADGNPVLRATAADLLGTLVPEHPEVVAPLMKAAEDRDNFVRQSALTSLSKTRVDWETILPLLGRLSLDEDSKVRGQAIRLLFKSSGGGKLFIMLNDSLSSGNPAVRAAAAEALRNFASRAQSAVPKLTALTNESQEPDANVRLQAAETLKVIAPETAQK